MGRSLDEAWCLAFLARRLNILLLESGICSLVCICVCVYCYGYLLSHFPGHKVARVSSAVSTSPCGGVPIFSRIVSRFRCSDEASVSQGTAGGTAGLGRCFKSPDDPE